MKKLKVLYVDVETAPLLSYLWRANQQWVPHEFMETTYFLICWSAQFADSTKMHSGVLTPKEALAQDDIRIAAELADLVREADVVVAHNADQFDLPTITTRLMLRGLEPLGPYRTIDTLKIAKRDLNMPYNNLDHLAEALGLGKKRDTKFELWRRCIQGEKKALSEMLRYNKHDVVLLIGVFDKMKRYVRNLTRLVDAEEQDEMACPHCGSDELIGRGYYRTQASNFHKLQCKGCGRYCRLRKSIPEAKLGVHPL